MSEREPAAFPTKLPESCTAERSRRTSENAGNGSMTRMNEREGAGTSENGSIARMNERERAAFPTKLPESCTTERSRRASENDESGWIRRKDQPERTSIGRATFTTLTAFTALTALFLGCSSNSGRSAGAASGGQGRAAYAPVQNERFAVTSVELSAILMDNQKYARWSFALKLRQPIQLRSIRIEDVTEGTPALLINDQAPQVEGGAWSGYTGAIEPSASALPWLFDNNPARRIFRFTVTDLNGQDSVLEQTVTYPVKSKKELIKSYGFSA